MVLRSTGRLCPAFFVTCASLILLLHIAAPASAQDFWDTAPEQSSKKPAKTKKLSTNNYAATAPLSAAPVPAPAPSAAPPAAVVAQATAQPAATAAPPDTAALWNKDLTSNWDARKNPKHEAAAKVIQQKLAEIGCLEKDGQWNDGGWGRGSQLAFQKFKAKLEKDYKSIRYQSADDLAKVLSYLDKYGVADWKPNYAACATAAPGPKKAVFAKCDLPKLRVSWARDRDKAKGRDKDNNGLEALYRSLPNVEQDLFDYYPAAASSANAAWIKAIAARTPQGKAYDPDKIFGVISDFGPMIERHLSYISAAGDFSCQRCLLLDAFKSLHEVANSNGILKDPVSDKDIYAKLISFEMVDAQLENIQRWRDARASGDAGSALLGEILTGFDGLKSKQAKLDDKEAPFSLKDKAFDDNCSAFVAEISR